MDSFMLFFLFILLFIETSCKAYAVDTQMLKLQCHMHIHCLAAFGLNALFVN